MTTRVTVELDVPKVGQWIRTIRGCYGDDGCGGITIPPGIFGIVTEVTKDDEVVITLHPTTDQQTILKDTLDRWEKLFGSLEYGFIDDASIMINGSMVNGLLEFHLTCEYI